MSRPKAHPQTLKHLPFFEVLASAPEGSAEAKLATAGLLALRMIDHWVLAGPAIVEPESVSVRSVRQAIMALPPKEPVRESLLTIVNTMQMLRHVDLVPVLPRVFAYAQLLERHHGSMALAADAYRSIIRLGDVEHDAEVVMDSYYRLAFCERKVGALDEALETSTAMAKLAGRRKDRVRTLRAKMGVAQVAMMRGDWAAADSQFVAIAKDAQHHELTREYAMATHNRAVVAARSGNSTDAILLAHDALQNTSDPIERDRVLGDLAAMLLITGRVDAALDALRILELTAVSEEPRVTARVNIVAVAVRSGDRALFDSARANLRDSEMPIEARINLLAETARGFEIFGDPAAARALKSEAERLAGMHGLEQLLVQHHTAQANPPAPPRSSVAIDEQDPTYPVASSLRMMAAAVAA